MERERESKLTRILCSKRKDKYKQEDGLFSDSEEHKWWSSNRCTRFLLKLFEMEYNRHRKLAKQLKERNDEISQQIMV